MTALLFGVIGTVLGAVVAAVGSYLVNRHNAARADAARRDERAHDDRRRSDEREDAARVRADDRAAELERLRLQHESEASVRTQTGADAQRREDRAIVRLFVVRVQTGIETIKREKWLTESAWEELALSLGEVTAISEMMSYVASSVVAKLRDADALARNGLPTQSTVTAEEAQRELREFVRYTEAEAAR